MKKLAIATLIASTFASTAFASEQLVTEKVAAPVFDTTVSLEVEDVNKDVFILEIEDIALADNLNLDIEAQRGDATQMEAGVDYTLPEFVPNLTTVAGVAINSAFPGVVLELDGTYTIAPKLAAFTEMEYAVVTDGGRDAAYAELGVAYAATPDLSLATSYTIGKEIGFDAGIAKNNKFEVGAAYKVDEKLTAEIEHTFDLENDNNQYNTEVVANYAVTQRSYVEATYTMNDDTDLDAFGVEVGYKF